MYRNLTTIFPSVLCGWCHQRSWQLSAILQHMSVFGSATGLKSILSPASNSSRSQNWRWSLWKAYGYTTCLGVNRYFWICFIRYVIFCHRSFDVISTSWSKFQCTQIKTRFYIICWHAENLLIRCSVYWDLLVTGEHKGTLFKLDIKFHSPCILWSHSHSPCLGGFKRKP